MNIGASVKHGIETVLGTPDICDEYADSVQVAAPVFHSFGGLTRISAEMVTLKIDQDNTSFWELLRQPGGGKVLVVDNGGQYCAVMGDKMAYLAVKNNWKGMVINGYIRDSAIIEKLPLAVWALGKCPIKGPKKADYSRHITLEFASMKIDESLHLYADEDGIVISQQKLDAYELHF